MIGSSSIRRNAVKSTPFLNQQGEIKDQADATYANVFLLEWRTEQGVERIEQIGS